MSDAYSVLIRTLKSESGVSAGVLHRIARGIAMGDGSVTRMQLADELGMSAGTVSKAVEKLIASGLVRGVQSATGGRGRPTTGLQLADERFVCLGVRIADNEGHVNELTGAISTLNGRPLFFTESVPVDTHGDGEGPDLVDQVEDFVRQTLLRQAALLQTEVLGLGVELGGHVQAGVIRRSTNDPCLNGLPLGPELQSRLPFPVVVENDVTALSVLEQLFSGLTEERTLDKSFTVVGVFNEGIGAGVVTRGGVWRGAHGLVAELGHIPVSLRNTAPWSTAAEPDGARALSSELLLATAVCRCGRSGCLEALSTPAALLRRCRAVGIDLPDGLPADTAALDGMAATAVRRTFTEGGAALGQALSTFVNLTDPGRIVLLLHPRFSDDTNELAHVFHTAMREELRNIYSAAAEPELKIRYFDQDGYRRLHARAAAAVVLEKLLLDLDSGTAGTERQLAS